MKTNWSLCVNFKYFQKYATTNQVYIILKSFILISFDQQ